MYTLQVLQKAADGSGMEYLEDAIRRGDVTLVNAVAKILGNQVRGTQKLRTLSQGLIAGATVRGGWGIGSG